MRDRVCCRRQTTSSWMETSQRASHHLWPHKLNSTRDLSLMQLSVIKKLWTRFIIVQVYMYTYVRTCMPKEEFENVSNPTVFVLSLQFLSAVKLIAYTIEKELMVPTHLHPNIALKEWIDRFVLTILVESEPLHSHTHTQGNNINIPLLLDNGLLNCS